MKPFTAEDLANFSSTVFQMTVQNLLPQLEQGGLMGQMSKEDLKTVAAVASTTVANALSLLQQRELLPEQPGQVLPQ